jgi:hypothetical protein
MKIEKASNGRLFIKVIRKNGEMKGYEEKKYGYYIICKSCGKRKFIFDIGISKIKQGWGKFCSKSCSKKLIYHPNWKGGRTKETGGYILIKIPTHPFATCRGYVREHRIIIEQKIGRFLKPQEEVHHCNGNRADNRLDNLMLFPNKTLHTKYHHRLEQVKPIEVKAEEVSNG